MPLSGQNSAPNGGYANAGSETVWTLPPLILHPFNERVPPSTLLENSRAALMLSGLIPADGADPDELNRRLLAGRYSELRMLFFLGKDVFRWINQCLDWAGRMAGLQGMELRQQSFAALLTGATPPEVKEKLGDWGVADYVAIFSRAMGLNTVFTAPPAVELLSADFLRNYHSYADSLYRCFLALQPYTTLPCGRFQFQLYASGEYSRMLESEWEASGE
jgi:hypothetical protein